VEGKVKPSKRKAVLLVDKIAANRTRRRVGNRVVRVRAGRALASYRFTHTGRYWIRIGVTSDAKNLSARSEPIEIRVR
jgi:hypothetical protein